ncbi:iron-containing alcohol dehydrogenase [Ketobacter alkanivorans]|uniref:NADH-dependent alcohol dehydrogenase n=1 Tax=Ketobacter alkanivorans TaxID=1917421 RepID=A0A2K9LNI7_9GAMM|nr:iron-containing alcohol dehydrogenase [Ketobacter alkanivorans]AUM12354.1 NADH-dependent alcohol dehydrogenase [Ketobacter alkanivorans]
MLNFDFYNPTRICFGEGRIKDLDKLVPANARPLILYGGSSAERTGTLAEVKAGLGDRDALQFGGIEPNPTFETLSKAVEVVRNEGVDFLLAVGGGSVIDGTKFVAAAACYDSDPWEILTTNGAKIKSALPFGTVLTLPATGSEMNNGGVVTRQSIHAKLPFRSKLLFPQFSVLDPTKSYTLPERQVANGVVDAFVHIVEQYLTYPVNARVQDRFAEGLLQTLIEIGPDALKKPDDYDVRANLMWVASLALNGLIGAGVPQDWATHMIGHEITALYGLDHAQTLAIVLPAVLEHQREAKGKKLLQYGSRVWGINDGTEEQRISAAISKTREFFESLGVRTRLGDYQLQHDTIAPLIAQLEAHGMKKLGEHRDITPEASQQILEACL